MRAVDWRIMVWVFLAGTISACLPEPRSSSPLPEPLAAIAQHGPLSAGVRPLADQCLSCHGDEEGFSPFHPVAAIGCSSCHLGDPDATTEEAGHAGMTIVPGNLADADQTCGAPGCHAEWVERVRGSLMGTGRGLVSVDRWVFGEQGSPDGDHGMQDLGNSPADEHLKQLCQTCHLGTPKTRPGALDFRSRGGGCLACHLTYNGAEGNHARLSARVPDERCEGCHSRSGRISLNYAGWHETVLDPGAAEPGMRLLPDGRVLAPQASDVHHQAGLSCVDCHTSRELMGDGNQYQHQEEATEVTCISCHEADTSRSVRWAELPQDDQRLILLRSGVPPASRRFGLSDITSRPISNLVSDSGNRFQLLSKSDSTAFPLRRPTDACRLQGHERVACQTCHSTWVPQCIGCHTQRLDDDTWVEMISDFRADPPVLGARTVRDPEGSIQPFAPGMIMTLGVEPVPAHESPAGWVGRGILHRLYAAAVPHTTSSEGRTCMSCHLDPLALGFGRGVLSLRTDGSWLFSPEYESISDGLPADAWIPFDPSMGRALEGRPSSTRSDTRPLNAQEIDRILFVGACLTCHPAERSANGTIFEDFSASRLNVAPACVLPSGRSRI
jgi:hypothetical protein